MEVVRARRGMVEIREAIEASGGSTSGDGRPSGRGDLQVTGGLPYLAHYHAVALCDTLGLNLNLNRGDWSLERCAARDDSPLQSQESRGLPRRGVRFSCHLRVTCATPGSSRRRQRRRGQHRPSPHCPFSRAIPPTCTLPGAPRPASDRHTSRSWCTSPSLPTQQETRKSALSRADHWLPILLLV